MLWRWAWDVAESKSVATQSADILRSGAGWLLRLCLCAAVVVLRVVLCVVASVAGRGVTFDMIDANGDGVITRREFDDFVRQLQSLKAKAQAEGGWVSMRLVLVGQWVS